MTTVTGRTITDAIGLSAAELLLAPASFYRQNPERWDFFDKDEPSKRYRINGAGRFAPTSASLGRVSAVPNARAQIAQRCIFATGSATPAVAGGATRPLAVTSRTRHTTAVGGSDIQITYANLVGNSGGGEQDAAAPITVTASIEYPLGVVYPLTFGGATSVTIARHAKATSDPVPIDVLPGSDIWVTQCVIGTSYPVNVTTIVNSANSGRTGDMLGAKITGATNASPIVITTATPHNFTAGDTATIVAVAGNTAANGTWVVGAVTSTTFALTASTGNAAYTNNGYAIGSDLTAQGGLAMLTSGGVNVFGPVQILGVPLNGVASPWVAAYGDSIGAGSGDIANAGWINRWLGSMPGLCTIPLINLCRPGTRVSQFVDQTNMPTQSIGRRGIGMGAPFTINEFARNDWGNAATLAQLQANTLLLATSSWQRGGKHFTATAIPGTASSDGWTTAANQTTIAGEAVRTAWNDWLRAGAPIDPVTLAAVPIGTFGALLIGATQHPIYGVIDIAATCEVDVTNTLAINGGRLLIPVSNGVPVAATLDGTHPATALVVNNMVPGLPSPTSVFI